MPKVSIIMPVYNGEKYLEEAIRSILDQTLQDWELWLVNDCSTDSSLKIMEKYAKGNDKIQIITNPENYQLPRSLNIGFRYARGSYLTWTSDDNLYQPDAMETMVRELDEHPDYGLVCCDMDYLFEDGSIMKHRFPEASQLYLENVVGACFLYRREILETVGEYDPDTFLVEDYDYWLRISQMKKNVAIWGWWQGKNLGDNWINRTLREVFPNYEFIDTSVMDFSPYDFVICGGGGLYIYDVIEPWRSHTPPIPYGMLGLGAEFPHASSWAEELCSKSEFFFLRDQYSLDCMKIKNVERSYDVTFLRPLERKEIQSINLDKLLFVWRDGKELTRNPKFREYIQYSDNFEQWKKVIQAHFNCIERNDFQTTADNIEAVMENCGFVISGRFHGIAAAIQKGIPCIAIDICPKIRALMEDCGLKEYCIKVSETDKLGELITRAKAEYRDIRKKQQDYKAKANLTLLKHIEVVKEAIDRALHPLRAIHYGSYWMGENDVVKAMADDLGDVFISQVIDLKAYSSHSDTRIKECTPTPKQRIRRTSGCFLVFYLCTS